MRKVKHTYYFSVEGETEKWYLDWLQRSINAEPSATGMVKLDCKIQKDPISMVKGMPILGKTEITHIFDRESEEAFHQEQFKATLKRMKQAQELGKNIQYTLGYSNFTFELWIILHKADCNTPLTHRRQYLAPLNRAFGEQFEDLNQYKQEDNFKRILNKLTLGDVWQAIRRSEAIMERNRENGFALQKHCGYCFYRENPSLTLWEPVKRILMDCGMEEG